MFVTKPNKALHLPPARNHFRDLANQPTALLLLLFLLLLLQTLGLQATLNGAESVHRQGLLTARHIHQIIHIISLAVVVRRNFHLFHLFQNISTPISTTFKKKRNTQLLSSLTGNGFGPLSHEQRQSPRFWTYQR